MLGASPLGAAPLGLLAVAPTPPIDLTPQVCIAARWKRPVIAATWRRCP